MRASIGIASVVLVALTGCSTGGAPGEVAPTVYSLTPSITDARAIDLEIHGDGFFPIVATDFSRKGQSHLDATFAVSLAPADGGAPIALAGVERISAQLLRASVPAGLAKGGYDLVLTDPSGRETRLTSALQVVTSAESVAGFRFEAIGLQRLGVPFTVLLTAVDQSGQVVDGFDGTVTLTDSAGSVSVTSELFLLGRGRGEVTAGVTGSWVLSAQDSLGHLSQSAAFEVRAGLPVRARILEAPSTVAAGGCGGPLRFRLDDAFGNPADLEGAVDVSLRALPEDALFFSDPGCTAVVAAVPVTAPSEVYFRGVGPGALQLHLLPDGLVHASHVLAVTP
jgi:hypothetical protein